MGQLWPSGIATETFIIFGNHRKTIQTYFMVLAAELLRCGVLIRAPQRTIEPLNGKEPDIGPSCMYFGNIGHAAAGYARKIHFKRHTAFRRLRLRPAGTPDSEELCVQRGQSLKRQIGNALPQDEACG